MFQEDDLIDHTPTAQLLSKHDEVNQINISLVSQKEEFQLKMEALQLRREQLNRKEEQLKQNLTKFDKFLRENESKKGRAIRKAAEERRLKELKESEIGELRALFKKLNILKDKQHAMIQSYVVFQKYLDTVVEASGNEYHEPRDIIARQETLNATNTDLIERCRLAQDKTDHYRAVFMKLNDEKNNTILAFTNELDKLQTKLEEVKLKSQKAQEEWEKIISTASMKSLSLGQIRMAANNLFNIVKSHMHHRILQTSNTHEQFDRIEQAIIDFEIVTKELKSRIEKEKSLQNTEKSKAKPSKNLPRKETNEKTFPEKPTLVHRDTNDKKTFPEKPTLVHRDTNDKSSIQSTK